MGNLTIKIDKEFLNEYRQYKIDRTTDESFKEDFAYTTLEYMLNDGWTIQSLLDELADFASIAIDVVTREIVNKEEPGLDMKKFMEELKRQQQPYTPYKKADEFDWTKYKKGFYEDGDNPYKIDF